MFPKFNQMSNVGQMLDDVLPKFAQILRACLHFIFSHRFLVCNSWISSHISSFDISDIFMFSYFAKIIFLNAWYCSEVASNASRLHEGSDRARRLDQPPERPLRPLPAAPLWLLQSAWTQRRGASRISCKTVEPVVHRIIIFLVIVTIHICLFSCCFVEF